MIFKLLLAVLVAYAGWRLWKNGFGAPRKRIPAGARVAEPIDAAAARQLLGLPPGADEASIRAAHRRLMAEAHPDRGGSAEAARALNAARDLLLGRAG
jgi:DnaJ homolog subfamily C member 19